MLNVSLASGTKANHETPKTRATDDDWNASALLDTHAFGVNMTNDAKKKLLRVLGELLDKDHSDPESDHLLADRALIEYINDPEVQSLWDEVSKVFWYS